MLSLPAILPVGTAVVVATRVGAHPTHPRGAAGVITQAPLDWEHAYRVRFPGGEDASFLRHEIEVLTHFQAMAASEGGATNLRLRGLQDRVVLRVVIGSRAYGLDHANSDFDRRGVYVPRAQDHWSLAGVPEQLEDDATQECYWEIGKFISLALKANPNVLETLWSPLVEHAAGPGAILRQRRNLFLSQLVFTTFNGYAQSQFKKLGTDLKNHGEIKWQHAMHLVRLLLAGIGTVKTGELPVRVEGPHKDRLLAIRAGAEKWEAVDAWRLQLHAEFEEAFRHTRLPERPDYAGANEILVEARGGGRWGSEGEAQLRLAWSPTATRNLARGRPRLGGRPWVGDGWNTTLKGSRREMSGFSDQVSTKWSTIPLAPKKPFPVVVEDFG